MSYYDDNYGYQNDDEYGFDDREELAAFRRHTAQNSVWKTCTICGAKVKLMPHYDKCDRCCRRIEGGWEY